MTGERMKFDACEVRSTDLARLLELPDDREIWVPESLLLEYPGMLFSVPLWWAVQHDIDGDVM